MADATLARLERVTARLEELESRLSTSSKGGAPSSAASEPQIAVADSVFVTEYDNLIKEHFTPLLEKAKTCGPDAEKIMAEFQNAIDAQRKMLVIASRCRKPADDATLQSIVKPTSELLAKVESCRDRRSKLFNHVSMVAEGVACLQWVCIDKTPASFLGDVIPGSEMYGNKIIMEFKGKDEVQVAFAKDFKTFLLELQKYVRAHHATGLSWNAKGGTDYAAAGPAAAPPAAAAPAAKSGPPAAPPPPPPGFFDQKPKAAAAAPVGGAAALFAELNAKGERGVTAGLKKVSKDEMTHKNPALRASSVVTAQPKAAGASTGGAAVAAPKKAAKMEQQGSKWFIEHFEGNRELQVTDCTVKTAVCLVQCKTSLLQIPGKINTLQIDGCTKTSVVVDSCVASIDIINCKSCEIQVTGTTPMVTMDGCAGIMLYLSPQCLTDDVSIVSSKCSEINVVLPAKSDDLDPVELPVPEQFETKIVNGHLVTTAISHVGA